MFGELVMTSGARVGRGVTAGSKCVVRAASDTLLRLDVIHGRRDLRTGGRLETAF